MSTSQKILKLKSRDDLIFEVSEAAAFQSGMIKNMLKDDCADDAIHIVEVEKRDVIPILEVDGRFLAMVIEYWNKHLSEKASEDEIKRWDVEFVNKDQSLLYHLIMAANYLDTPGLIELLCWRVAEMIKGRKPEEIRQTFNIKNDLSPEDEAEIYKQYAWAFE